MSQVAGSRQGHRVVVLSNHALTRAGLAQLLAQENVTLSVVESPRRVAQVGRHEVVLYDLADESGNSLDDLALVLAEGAPIVALTSPGRSHLAETILAMGVSETVQMDVRADGLVQALGRVAAGQTTSLEAHRRRRRDAARVGTELTDREASVLELIGAGLSNQEIADRLFVTINTLKTYIRTAYRKIGVSRRPQAVLWAARHDLIRGPRQRHPARRSEPLARVTSP
jgi:DNA-binding NarL/FixJ family response regulator